MSAVAVVICWYLVGFVLVDRLVARGHSAPLWWPAAAILGAAVALPALVAVRRTRVAPLVIGEATTASEGLHIVDLASRAEGASTLERLPLSIAARAGRTSLVGLVGQEAFARAVDTGERSHMIDHLSWQRPLADDVDRLVVPDSPAGIDAAVGVVGVPDLVATPIGGSRRAVRRGVARALDLARRHAVAVALLPPDAASPALSMRVSEATQEVSS